MAQKICMVILHKISCVINVRIPLNDQRIDSKRSNILNTLNLILYFDKQKIN